MQRVWLLLLLVACSGDDAHRQPTLHPKIPSPPATERMRVLGEEAGAIAASFGGRGARLAAIAAFFASQA